MKAKVVSTVSRAKNIIIVVWFAAMSLGVVPAYFVEQNINNVIMSLVLRTIY